MFLTFIDLNVLFTYIVSKTILKKKNFFIESAQPIPPHPNPPPNSPPTPTSPPHSHIHTHTPSPL